jgi:hypothetical protein
LDKLIKQEEGVQLWRTSSADRPYFIRSLRTRETQEFQTETEAAEAYRIEVEYSRDCAIVQKKLGAF